MSTVEFYQDDSEKKEWRWTVKAGETVLGKSSESFPKFCLPADVKVASEDPENSKRPLSFYQDTATPSQWRWRVTAGNGLITHASAKGWDTKQEAIDNVGALDNAVKGWNDAG